MRTQVTQTSLDKNFCNPSKGRDGNTVFRHTNGLDHSVIGDLRKTQYTFWTRSPKLLDSGIELTKTHVPRLSLQRQKSSLGIFISLGLSARVNQNRNTGKYGNDQPNPLDGFDIRLHGKKKSTRSSNQLNNITDKSDFSIKGFAQQVIPVSIIDIANKLAVGNFTLNSFRHFEAPIFAVLADSVESVSAGHCHALGIHHLSCSSPLLGLLRFRSLNPNIRGEERHLQLKKVRYTVSKCLITRRFGVKSPRQSAAFFTSIASMDEGGESGNTSRLAEPRLLTPSSTSSLNNGVVGLKNSFGSNDMAIKAKPLATPTHFFYPKFKAGDICRLKRFTGFPELNGLTVTLQSNLKATKNKDNQSQYWLGYEIDLIYKGHSFCPAEDQLTKIGDVKE